MSYNENMQDLVGLSVEDGVILAVESLAARSTSPHVAVVVKTFAVSLRFFAKTGPDDKDPRVTRSHIAHAWASCERSFDAAALEKPVDNTLHFKPFYDF